MNVNEELEKIKHLQFLTGSYTNVALENIKQAPFIFVDHLKTVYIEIKDDEIVVELVPKSGLKSWFYRKTKKKLINTNLTLLARYILTWCPIKETMPQIKFLWAQDDDK